MAAQNGKDLLLKVDLDGNGSFQTLAGLRASRLSVLHLGMNDIHYLKILSYFSHFLRY